MKIRLAVETLLLIRNSTFTVKNNYDDYRLLVS